MIITAPVNRIYASLNIAQAVLLVSYEWYKHEATSLGMATPELPAISGPGLQMPDSAPPPRTSFMASTATWKPSWTLRAFSRPTS